MVNVTVNGFGTTLGSSPDSNGNISFTTTNAIPVPTNGLPTVLNVVVTWANGVVDPPLGMLEGYYITSLNSQMNTIQNYSHDPCQTGPVQDTYITTYTFSPGSEMTIGLEDYQNIVNCGSGEESETTIINTNSDTADQPSVAWGVSSEQSIIWRALQALFKITIR